MIKNFASEDSRPHDKQQSENVDNGFIYIIINYNYNKLVLRRVISHQQISEILSDYFIKKANW